MGDFITMIALTDNFAVTPDDLLRQHLLILGATGSGKSTSAVTILHDLMMQNQTTIIIDPTGEYTKLPHAVVAKLGYNAFIDYEQLTGAEIAQIFGVTEAVATEKVVDAWQSLKIQKNVVRQSGVYQKINRPWATFEVDAQRLYDYPQPADMHLLPEQLQQEFAVPTDDFDLIGQTVDQAGFRTLLPLIRRIKSQTSQPAFQQLFNLPSRKKIATVGMRTDVMYLMRLFSSQRSEQKILVIDLSELADNLGLGKVVVSLLMTALLRIKQTGTQQLPVTVLIDEAHRYLLQQPGVVDGILRVAREGRKAGLYLMLTTQSPLDLPAGLLGQFGNYLIHRLNTATELAQLPALAPLGQHIALQQVGEAILVGNQFVPPRELQIRQVAAMQHQTASPKFF
ncbi:ATP-binding protein [Weissella cibaria]|nr:ATP-binding protein [Weissella cibaria]